MSHSIPSVAEVRAQVDQFVQSNISMNEYFNIIFNYLQDQVAKNQELENDLKAEKKSRYIYQQEADEYQQAAIKYKKVAEDLTTKNQFVVVLVDGDGAKFSDDLLNDPDPAVGAQKAADNLRKSVRNYLRQCGLDEDVIIIVRVFAHIAGLAKALTYSKVIPAPDRMLTFAEMFTNSCSDFDFVNVGWGKENADSKIRRNLAHYYNINQCKKIFLVGCCHDKPYLHELKNYTDQPNERIVLVETTPAHPEFNAVKFPIIKFDTVFRSEPLNNEAKRVAAKDIRASQTIGTAAPQPSRDLTASPPVNDGVPWPPLTPTPPDSQGSIKLEHSKKVAWSELGGKEGHQNITIKSSKPKEQPKFYYTNKDGIRLDQPVPKPGPKTDPVQESYRDKVEYAKKAGKKGLCNRHYLQGHCDIGDYCYSDHTQQLTRDEINILRYVARQSPCNLGKDCYDLTCPFAHQCPHGKEGCSKWSKRTCDHTLHLSEDQKKPFYKNYTDMTVERA